MNDKLFKAILSMDAYNRGYGAGIQLPTVDSSSIDQQLALATIYKESDIAAGSEGRKKNFYALAYDYNGETIISYRGTNDAADPLYGWGLGGGLIFDPQTIMAVDFYKDVVGAGNYMSANVSFTGHSQVLS